MKNKLFRITENDVHVIIENIVHRIIKENYYDQKSVVNTWMDIIDRIGVDEFVSLIDNKEYEEVPGYDWDIEDIYEELEQETGLSYDELEAMEPGDLSDLMQDRLSQGLQYKILKYVSDEYDLGLTDNMETPDEVYTDIDNFDDSIDNTPSMEGEVEVEDDEEYEDPEFRGMNDLD